MLEAQRGELDRSRRVQLMHQIHRRLRDQAPYIFEITVARKRVFRKNIRGIQIGAVKG